MNATTPPTSRGPSRRGLRIGALACALVASATAAAWWAREPALAADVEQLGTASKQELDAARRPRAPRDLARSPHW